MLLALPLRHQAGAGTTKLILRLRHWTRLPTDCRRRGGFIYACCPPVSTDTQWHERANGAGGTTPKQMETAAGMGSLNQLE